MEKADIKKIMEGILARQGKPINGIEESTSLRDLQFRSLDFSELCLKVEDLLGKELNFEAASLRKIETVKDVYSFLETVSSIE